MSIIYKQLPDPEAVIGVWRIEEDMNALLQNIELSDRENHQLHQFKHEPRKLQFLATRVLVAELCCQLDGDLTDAKIEIMKEENGKPFLKNSSFHLSLSHSHNRAAVIIHKSKAVGLDIELIQPKIERIAHKFIPENDIHSFDESSKIEQMHVFWGAKESIFKLYGKGGLNYLKDMNLQQFEYSSPGVLKAGLIKNKTNKMLNIRYEKLGEYMLTSVIDK
ncbi:4'-phosphopantetheinyl transferase superfamily protein [Candidatus Amoebophilus asiaticus]|nr:4'-phosphopantetheinyl transferase superfamily protein [Candidatus Amoebophilus asiaticus]